MHRQVSPWKTRMDTLVFIAVVFAVIAAVFVGAKYLKKSDEVVNNFFPADSVLPEIVETFAPENDGELPVKSHVSVNVGDTGYPVYVRAAIVITWKEKVPGEDGMQAIYFQTPVKGEDYEITLNVADWILESDGFYYYTKPVSGGGSTTELIERCAMLSTAEPPEGYTLDVEIIVQTVQAVGYTDGEEFGQGTDIKEAWRDAWGDVDALTTEAPETEAPETEAPVGSDEP